MFGSFPSTYPQQGGAQGGQQQQLQHPQMYGTYPGASEEQQQGQLQQQQQQPQLGAPAAGGAWMTAQAPQGYQHYR